MKGRDSCILVVLLEPLRKLLLILFGGSFRKAQVIIAGVEYGEEAC